MTDPHAFVPLGDIADYEGQPKTVRRDHDTIVFPAMTLTLEGIEALLGLMDKGVDEIDAYQQRAAGDEDGDEEGPVDDGLPRVPLGGVIDRGFDATGGAW